MAFRLQFNANKQIIGEQGDYTFSICRGSRDIEARKKHIDAFGAQVELRLLLFMRLAVDHVPMALVIVHVEQIILLEGKHAGVEQLQCQRAKFHAECMNGK